jgi:hypothetical protein
VAEQLCNVQLRHQAIEDIQRNDLNKDEQIQREDLSKENFGGTD